MLYKYTVMVRSSVYAELHCLSNFSFLRGASHPEELVARAKELGYGALAPDECDDADVAVGRMGLGQVSVYVQCAMKHTQDGNIVGRRCDQICDPVVSIEQDTDVAFKVSPILVTDFGEPAQKLRLLVDTCYYLLSRLRIVGSNIVKNIFKPSMGLFGPSYFCHARMRFCISSSDSTRPCRTSSRPRLTIRSNANSRMISS